MHRAYTFSKAGPIKRPPRVTGNLDASGSVPAASSRTLPPQQVRALLRRRWIVWGALAFSMLTVVMDRVSPGVVVDRLMADFAIGGTAVGSLAASYYYIYAVLQLPAGIFTDRFGPRRMVSGGTLLAALGCFLFAAAPNLAVAYAGRFLVGLGVAGVFTSIAKVQAEWFRTREYASVTGLIVGVATLGAVLGTAPLAILVAHLGWRVAFSLIGAFFIVAAVAAFRLVADRPAEVGLPSPRALEAIERGETVSLAEPATQSRPSLRGDLARVVRRRAIWPPFLAMLGIYGPYVAMIGAFGIPYLMQIYGLPRDQAAALGALTAIGMGCGGPLTGFLSDRLMRSRRWPYLLLTAGSALIWVLWAFWNGGQPPLPVLYVFYFLLGLTNAMFILGLTIAKELNPPELAGVATGFMNISSFAGAGLYQPLVGWLLDLGWTGTIVDGVRVYPLAAFQLTFFAAIAACLLALTGALLTPETYPKRGSGEW